MTWDERPSAAPVLPMLNVRCQANATLDVKGRVALPSSLRRAMEDAAVGSLVLTFNKGAIWGWDPATFERTVERRLMTEDPFADTVMDFAHAIVASAQDVEVDGQGRIRIPPNLRELAGLDKDIVVHSFLERLEIWDRARWDERFKEALQRTSAAGGMPGKGSAS